MNTNTLNNDAYNLIIKKIRTGELLLGQDISEEELAKELGTSRTPVREAILWLQREGYVKIYPRKGTFVNSFSLKEVLEIYTMRLLLEPSFIGSAMGIMTESSKKKLIEYREYNLKFMNDELAMESGEDFFIQDEELHLFMFSMAKNKYIEDILVDALNKCMLAKFSMFSQLQIKRSEVARQHVEFINAALEGKPTVFMDLYRKHIREARDVMIRVTF